MLGQLTHTTQRLSNVVRHSRLKSSIVSRQTIQGVQAVSIDQNTAELRFNSLPVESILWQVNSLDRFNSRGLSSPILQALGRSGSHFRLRNPLSVSEGGPIDASEGRGTNL